MSKYTLCGLTFLVASCGSSAEPPSNLELTTPRSDLLVTVSQAPSQPPNKRSPVKFDPCFEVSDKTVSEAGYSPETRKRIDQVHDGWAFIGCTFERIEPVRKQQLAVAHLTILSTNISVSEVREKEAERTTVNDVRVGSHAGISYRGEGMGSCAMTMDGPDSALSIDVSSVGQTEWNACEQMQRTAEIIEAALPE
ncbi:DUF3558 family protein [Nocardia sp. IBHARD005]|uniref:DUF3558 family protein n=1 Tax=Nocardia sp. IBHARD005 TaxID=3457765 RepID=UPI0040598FF1